MGLFEDRFSVLPGHPVRAELPAAPRQATRTALLRTAAVAAVTVWPDGFDPAAAGVVSRSDAPPIRPRNYEQAMTWPHSTGPDRT